MSRTEQPSTLSNRNARFFCRSSSGRDLSGSSGVSTNTDRQTCRQTDRQTDMQRSLSTV